MNSTKTAQETLPQQLGERLHACKRKANCRAANGGLLAKVLQKVEAPMALCNTLPSLWVSSGSRLLIPCMHTRLTYPSGTANFSGTQGTTFSRNSLDKAFFSSYRLKKHGNRSWIQWTWWLRPSRMLSLSQIQDSSLNKAPRVTVIHSRERTVCTLYRNDLKTKTESLRTETELRTQHLLLRVWRTRDKWKMYWKQSSSDRHPWATFTEDHYVLLNKNSLRNSYKTKLTW